MVKRPTNTPEAKINHLVEKGKRSLVLIWSWKAHDESREEKKMKESMIMNLKVGSYTNRYIHQVAKIIKDFAIILIRNLLILYSVRIDIYMSLGGTALAVAKDIIHAKVHT